MSVESQNPPGGDLPGPMSINEIKAVLPHRYPFLLIDKVVGRFPAPNLPNRTGSIIKAIKNVTINEPFFEGHFAHRPVMPGVLQIEAMAQACALLAMQPKEGEKQDVAIVGVEKTRFRKPVVPGDTLEIHGEVLKDRGAIVVFDAKCYVDSKVVSHAEIIAQIFKMAEVEV